MQAWLRLKLTPGVGDVTVRQLLAAFGLPTQVFRQTHHTLRTVVGQRLAEALLSIPAEWTALCQRTETWLATSPQRRLLTLGDPDYPPALLQIDDPPGLLHVDGDWTTLGAGPCVAVVGTRHPSVQGLDLAYQFAHDLSLAGMQIVSGLALGIDGAAHEGALAAGGQTVAVVGTGLDRVYPRQHHDLAHRIAKQGVLISECVLGTPPVAYQFPRRNRIISGLSQGVLIVEAALQSGSLITAQQAVEQGREVFAIPGSIHAPQSRGCHALIRQGAKLVESAQDILEDLPHNRLFTMPSSPPTPQTIQPLLEQADDPILLALGYNTMGLDVLQIRLGWATASLQARLLELELEGWVVRLPGGLYQRRAWA